MTWQRFGFLTSRFCLPRRIRRISVDAMMALIRTSFELALLTTDTCISLHYCLDWRIDHSRIVYFISGRASFFRFVASSPPSKALFNVEIKKSKLTSLSPFSFNSLLRIINHDAGYWLLSYGKVLIRPLSQVPRTTSLSTCRQGRLGANSSAMSITSQGSWIYSQVCSLGYSPSSDSSISCIGSWLQDERVLWNDQVWSSIVSDWDVSSDCIH